MKPRISTKWRAGLTILDVLVVITIVCLIALLLLPALAKNKGGPRPQCISNLKQIGLASRVWASDNDDKYLTQISVTNGGAMGLADAEIAGKNFLVMSNELSNPTILHCPFDKESVAATNFAHVFNASNLSYFVGLSAVADDPKDILSGDDNLEISGILVKSGILNLYSNAPIHWTKARHHPTGYIGLADGSVHQVYSAEQGQSFGLTTLLNRSGLATNRLAIP